MMAIVKTVKNATTILVTSMSNHRYLHELYFYHFWESALPFQDLDINFLN